MAETAYLFQIALDTGQERRSSRDEVEEAALAVVLDGIGRALIGERAAIPGHPGYTMTATGSGRCLMAIMWGLQPESGADVPLVALGVATHSRCGATLWRRMHEDAARPAPMAPLATLGRRCPPEPWLAVRLEIGTMNYRGLPEWIGEWERVVAWAWLSRNKGGTPQVRANS